MNAQLAAEISAFGAIAQHHIPVEIGKKAAVNIVINVALAAFVQPDTLKQPGKENHAYDGENQKHYGVHWSSSLHRRITAENSECIKRINVLFILYTYSVFCQQINSGVIG